MASSVFPAIFPLTRELYQRNTVAWQGRPLWSWTTALMGATQHNSERPPVSMLPKLGPDARKRVRTAELHAAESLMEHARAT